MPAVSKAQQKFFGIVRAIQKGKLEPTTPETAKVAATMKKKDVKDFASTDHKGLPEKKTEKRKKKKTLKEFMSEAYSQPERQSHKTPKLPVDRKLKIDYGNGKKKYNMPMPRGEYQKPSELTV